MLFTAFVSFSALVLCIIPVISISINENNVRNTPWVVADSKANGADLDLFIGLSGVVVRSHLPHRTLSLFFSKLKITHSHQFKTFISFHS